jgi:hypothetical protein
MVLSEGHRVTVGLEPAGPEVTFGVNSESGSEQELGRSVPYLEPKFLAIRLHGPTFSTRNQWSNSNSWLRNWDVANGRRFRRLDGLC